MGGQDYTPNNSNGAGKKRMKKSLETIDLAKFIASILICALHLGIFSDYNHLNIIPHLLSRWGVPFLFICSSYFFYCKCDNSKIEKDVLYKYVRRIAMLYIVWLVFNIPHVVYARLWSKDLLAIRTWLVFIKNSILSSTFIGSWYLSSSIFSVLFIYVLSKKLQTKTIMKITFIFYLLCVFSSAYRGVLPSNISKVLLFFLFPLNIFNGCFYFSLGKYIAENRQTILNKWNKKRSLIGFIIFYLLFVAEIGLTKYFKILGMTDVTFSTALMAYTLFLFCLQTSIRISNSLLLRKMSIVIYCAQGNVLLVNRVCRTTLKASSFLSSLISYIVLAAIFALVLYVQKKQKWKWTEYLT